MRGFSTASGKSPISIFRFLPLRKASSSISVFWSDPARGFCSVGSTSLSSFSLTLREVSAVRPLFPRCRSFGLTVRDAQKLVRHLRRASRQRCWFRVGEIILFPLCSFLIKTGRVGMNLNARFSATCSRKKDYTVSEGKTKHRSVKSRKHTPQKEGLIYIY